MPTEIECDDMVFKRCKQRDLVAPIMCIAGPAMEKNYRRPTNSSMRSVKKGHAVVVKEGHFYGVLGCTITGRKVSKDEARRTKENVGEWEIFPTINLVPGYSAKRIMINYMN